MPSYITHELIAKSAADLLPKEERSLALSAPDYYYLGAQGPDLYFFYKPQERKKNWGKILHRGAVYRWFECLLKALPTQKDKRDKCLAYALGFCTHLASDGAFHPFVYGYLREKGLKKKEHQRIENDWDVYFASTLEGTDVRGRRPFFDLTKILREGVLYAYLRNAADMFGKPIKKGAFKRCLRFFRWYLKHFHRRHFRYLLPIVPQLYPRQKIDPDVTESELFPALTEEKNADALYLSAARDAADRMREFLRATEGEKLPKTFSRHLLTGEMI